uniref:Transmembrane protein 14C n=2 Tax=Fundulus heteroclitus TaxID=8078 RepID=A0A3Q2NVF0_FUNHE
MFPCVLLGCLVFSNISVSHAEAGGFSSNGSAPATNMSVDWIGYGYATLVASGGVVGYVKAGSVPSLAAGLLFGGLAGFGAYQISNDPNNVWVSLGTLNNLTRTLSKHGIGTVPEMSLQVNGDQTETRFAFLTMSEAFRVTRFPNCHLQRCSYVRSSVRHHGEEVLRVEEVHAGWFDGRSQSADGGEA